jgi:hypothetical protein
MRWGGEIPVEEAGEKEELDLGREEGGEDVETYLVSGIEWDSEVWYCEVSYLAFLHVRRWRFWMQILDADYLHMRPHQQMHERILPDLRRPTPSLPLPLQEDSL